MHITAQMATMRLSDLIPQSTGGMRVPSRPRRRRRMLSPAMEDRSPMPDGPRYDDDFYAWTQHQAAVLREMPVSDNRFDREHVAEEIEDLGKSERDAVRSQIRRIIEHFLKLAYSPGKEVHFGWLDTVDAARQLLSDKMTPTLRRDAETSLDRLYDQARRQAVRSLQRYGEAEAADALSQVCPYSLDDICRDDWYPDTPDRQT